MSQDYGIERPPAHVQTAPRTAARWLVLIESAGPVLALLFTPSRDLAGDFDAGSEEVALMTRGLQPVQGASGAEWDHALAGHSAQERAAAQVYALDL
jgi:hypothetical protein